VLEPMAHQARQAKIVYQLVPARRIAQCRCRDYAITRAEQETRRPSAASVNRSLSKEADRLGPPWVSYETLQRMSTLKRTSRKSRERPARHDLAQASTLGIQLNCTVNIQSATVTSLSRLPPVNWRSIQRCLNTNGNRPRCTPLVAIAPCCSARLLK
jgi:hypothetical protein